VSLTFRAWILVLIFIGGLLGRAWMYTQIQGHVIHPIHVSHINKNESSQNDLDLEAILAKLLKKRRNEEINFAMVFSSTSLSIPFFSQVTGLVSPSGEKLFSAEIKAPLQPPI